MPTTFPADLDDFGTVPESQQTATMHRDRHQNVEDAVEALEAKVGTNGSADTSSLDYKIAQLTGPTGAGEVGYTQGGAGAANRTVEAKLREWVSVTDSTGVTGNGVASDQAGFNSALALGVPVFVPYTANHYVLTSLSDADRARLWGPGRVKVGGVDVQIASSPPRASPNTVAGNVVLLPDWQPSKWPTVDGSLQNGAEFHDVTRTGGFATYGVNLTTALVTAATSGGQLDTADTAWITHTNLTGGQVFGSWYGANTPARYLGQTYSGGAAIGQEINVGNRWSDFGLQTDVGGTRYTSGQQIVPDVLPAKDGDNLTTVTSITIASPGVVTVTAHGYTPGMGIVFTGSGTLPGGLLKDKTYFVLATGITANTFPVAETPGGTAVNTTGSFVGPISVRPAWPGTFGQVIGASVHGHRWWTGTLLRLNSIMPGGYGHYAGGGLVADQAPAAWMKAVGYWDRGVDMRGCLFSTYGIDFQGAQYTSGSVINFDFTASHTTTATAGGVAIPSGFQGYIKATMSGSPIAIPYLLRP